MKYKDIVEDVFNRISRIENKGELATYIPELAKIDPNKFGVFLSSLEGEGFGFGDCDERFSIQSISKVFTLCLAYKLLGEKIWERVGVEPSGTPFNSLLQLEHDNGIPRNPFLNGGALVVCDILISNLENPKEDLLDFIKKITSNTELSYTPKVVKSEFSVGFRNIALCNFIKSYGNIDNDPMAVLDLYFHVCSIEMSCKELSKSFLFIANNGSTLTADRRIITASQGKRINAIMQTCGFYDESGEFAFRVGLPGKSGVGGGIIAIHPDQYTITVWSPCLNVKGNSYKGIKFLEEFTTQSKSSIF